ncbi:hypothetical protein K438DRAFT_1800411 [Mycena galopus ATCC 62051]|nr:hypothetical protein K438DRAFT_1800411 [Mycena galopus ATCC 62051]
MAPPTLPSLSDEEQQEIESRCQDALFVAWNEDSAVKDINYHLQQLWETALRIGLAHGREEVKAVCRKKDHVARAAVAKEMEAERVWGYDVGWKLCSERLKTASTAPSPSTLPPSRSMYAAAVQTEPHSMSATAMQTKSELHSLSVVAVQTASTVVNDAMLDWAEDATALPISAPYSLSTLPSPRDFSALCTGISRPFVSLQRRRRRSPRSPSSWTQSNHFCRQHTKSRVYHPQKHTPSSFRFAAASNSFPPTPTQLDWDRDSRLRDLGRVLTALGWVRP